MKRHKMIGYLFQGLIILAAIADIILLTFKFGVLNSNLFIGIPVFLVSLAIIYILYTLFLTVMMLFITGVKLR